MEDPTPPGTLRPTTLEQADVYLCGAMTAVSWFDARKWRKYAAIALGNAGLKVLDPCDRDFTGKQMENMETIVHLDLADIGRSKAILVNGNVPSWGSAMEVVHATAGKKLVVTIFDGYVEDVAMDADVHKPTISPWLVYFSDLVVPTVDEACDYLINKLTVKETT